MRRRARHIRTIPSARWARLRQLQENLIDLDARRSRSSRPTTPNLVDRIASLLQAQRHARDELDRYSARSRGATTSTPRRPACCAGSGSPVIPVPPPRPGCPAGQPGDGKVPILRWRDFQSRLPTD